MNYEKQKYLGEKGLLVFIAVMNMFAPLTIDLYLPALPTMSAYFSASTELVNLTLVGFFSFFAVGILLFGPLSDKYGRRPILIVGLLLYTIASLLCAVSESIWALISFRILQAFGAGSLITVSMALLKDCFQGKLMEKILAIIQAMFVIAPMTAPVIGAFILQFTSWRGTFYILAIIGILTLPVAYLLQETLRKEDRYTGTLLGSLSQLVTVGKNPSFANLLLIFSLFAAPYMAYIAVSAYIYIEYFHLSEQTYSYFFAFNSFAAVLGPAIYLQSIKSISAKKFAHLCFVFALISSLAIIYLGTISPWMFMLSFLIFTVVESAIRPFSTSLLLRQQEHDIGSASALINAIQTVLGSLGMLLATIGWNDLIVGLGVITGICTFIAAVWWLILLKLQIPITEFAYSSANAVQPSKVDIYGD